MKITSIEITNFLGARKVSLEIVKPVMLLCGPNHSGKSSVRDAVALAITADLGRISLKKDASRMINDGGSSAAVEVATASSETYAVAISATGKISDSHAGRDTPRALPCIINAQRFADLDLAERKNFLFELMKVRLDGSAVTARLIDRGADPAAAEQIAPFLRAGFDAAAKEAAGRAREAKASWKTVTGGETWGKDKASKWKPEAPQTDEARATALRDSATAKIREIDQEIGAAKERQQMVIRAQKKRDALTEIASRQARAADKLALDKADLEAWTQKVSECRARATPAAQKSGMLHDLATALSDSLSMLMPFGELDGQQRSRLANANAVLKAYEAEHGKPGETTPHDAESAAKLPEYENALALLQRAVTNDERDLAAATAAATELKELESSEASAAGTEPLETTIAKLETKRAEWQADADKYRGIAESAARWKAAIEQAAKHHVDVLAWTLIAEALSPDGIPGELLAEAIGPINERLRASADLAQWAQPCIHADMRITSGARDYALLSESEQWRTNALIAEAISHLAGVKLLVLDRIDVLDMLGREDLLYWLDGMAECGEIDTALLFGTMKTLPSALPDRVEAHWIEGGIAGMNVSQVSKAA